MQGLSKTTAQFFAALFQLADENDGYFKLNTTDSFMPLTIERLREGDRKIWYSVMHTYVQNGDLMRDPEIVFAVEKWTLEHPDNIWIAPVEYRQDNLGIHVREMLRLEGGDGNATHWKQSRYIDTVRFCTMWARNIKEQQSLMMSKGQLVMKNPNIQAA